MKLSSVLLLVFPIALMFATIQLYSIANKCPAPSATETHDVHANLPSYFNRFLTTNKLHDLLMDYSKFHNSELERLVRDVNNNSCSYGGEELNGRGLLIVRPESATGLANNIFSIVSSFLIAMLSGRALLISYPGFGGSHAPLHKLFRDPNKLFSWNYKDFYNRNSEWRKSQCLFDPLSKHADLHHEKYDTLLDVKKMFLQDRNSIKIFMCRDMRRYFDSIGDRIVIQSNQYLAPLLFLNLRYQPILLKMFPDRDAFGPLSRFLLHPVDELQEKIDDFLIQNNIQVPAIYHNDPHTRETVNKFANNKYKMQGIQIRRDDNENNWIKDYHEQYYYQCAQLLSPSSTLNDHKIFVVSDNSTSKQNALNYFRNNSISYDSPLLNSRDEESVKHALVDMFLLSYSHQFIVSHFSTFGSVAHARASTVPVIVDKRPSDGNVCASTDMYAGHDILAPSEAPCHYFYVIRDSMLKDQNNRWCSFDIPQVNL
jgi:hypothetical protein